MRTYVVSDVHGHLADLRGGLRAAGLVDDTDHWVPDDARLYVLGDLMDRGPDGIGAVHFARALQEQAPDRVHVLMGNHEALMLGQHLFPGTRFTDVWLINGGHFADQEGLTEEDVAWLRGLPVMARCDDELMVHSDTTGYLEWGSTVDEVNATVAGLLAGNDPQTHFDVFARLTGRYDYAGVDGPALAKQMLETYGGKRIVHGHSIIGSLIDVPSAEVDAPIAYADGLVVAIDGGRYDGGPLLLVELTNPDS